MPNYCYSNALITAKTKEELEEFLAFIKKPHFSYFTGFHDGQIVGEVSGVFWNFKQPEDFNEYFNDSVEVGEVSNPNVFPKWYDWNVANWGTKWDIDPPEFVEITEMEDHSFFVWDICTAWSPPQPAYKLMAERFPNLTFEYEVTEEANFYAGKVLYENGELVHDQWVENPTHDDFIEIGVSCVGCSDDGEPCRLGKEDEEEA